MLEVADFILKYEKYTDEELYHIHQNIDGYSDEASDALSIVLKKRGGFEPLLKRLMEKQIIQDEIKRIRENTIQLGNQGMDPSFIKATTNSKILSLEKVNEIIENKYVDVKQDLEDKKIDTRTIIGSIAGGMIASLVGGILWGLQLIYTDRIFHLLGIGLAMLCYGIIKIVTKRSKNNNVVFIATIISFILAVAIGQFLYEMIG